MKSTHWLLLITNLPGRNQTLRMRVWRALKSAGAASLRDGVYLLPESKVSRQVFEEQAREIQSGGGSVQIVNFESNGEQRATFVGLFRRADEYVAMIGELDVFKRKLAKLDETEARRRLSMLQRDAAALMALDFFPGESRSQLEQSLIDAEDAFNAQFSPDEPHAMQRKIARRDPTDYRGRTWATRQHLWVDRVCSAWLIRRFIDSKAKFVWLKHTRDCPKRALGFDFDGAEFTHIDGKVTFEVLLASFGLEHDGGLQQLARLVHSLDVGGIPVPEAPGFAAILTGARASEPNDDALIKAVFPVIDHLYAAYGTRKD